MIGTAGLLATTNNHFVKMHLDWELPISLHWQNKGQITNALVYADLGLYRRYIAQRRSVSAQSIHDYC